MFLLAVLAFFGIALPDAMLGVAWPFMRITFDQPLAAMTLVLPFGVAATVVSTSGWTAAVARFGLGRLLAGSVALSTAGLLCSALAPAYWVVVACAVPFGLSAGAIDAALNAYAARHFGPRRINWMHAAYGLGAATSPMIVTVAVNSGAGWRAAYLAVMAVQGVLAMLFAASARAWNQAVVPSEPSVSRPRSRWRPRPRALAGVLLIFVESGLESVVGLWSYVFLLQAVTLAPATAGWVVSGYWAALVAGRVLLGSLAERLGTWPVLAGATIAVIVAAGTIASGQPLAAAAGVVLLGLAVAPVYPLLVLTTAERTMADSVDRLVGFQATASTLGSVSCAGAAGLILGADVTAFRFCALALALMTGAGTWFLAPGRHRGSGSGGRVR